MPINDMYQAGTNKVLDDRASRPLPEPVPQRSFGASLWGMVSSVPKGVTAGTAETGSFLSDILGAYGEVQAGYAAQLDPSLMFDPAKAEAIRKEGENARANVATGEAFNTEAGATFRSVARSYMPDPQSASTAENLLFGLGRFATKAVGYTALGGPAVGATLTGADEALAESARLQEQGVDIQTRTKVGAVAGVTSALAVALPVSGRTLGETAGLVLGGGPGGFIAQQAASKAILQNAGYDQIGNQYDPFDPVGLAVSTLVPAAFGAHGLRTSQRAAAAAAERPLTELTPKELRSVNHADPRLDDYAMAAAQREGIPPEALLAIKNVGERSESGAVSPKGAKGVMQFTDSTWQAYGQGGDRTNPMASIDAGARYMKDLIAQYNGDVRAAIAHYNGGGKAGEAVRAGKEPPAKETRDYLQRTDQFMAEKGGELGGRAAADDPEMVAAARVQQVRDNIEAQNLGERTDPVSQQQHMDGVLRAADQIAAGERVDIGDSVPLDSVAQSRLLDTFENRLDQSRVEAVQEAGQALAPAQIEQLRNEINRLQESKPVVTGDAIRALAEEIKASDNISYDAALSHAKNLLANRTADINAQISQLRGQIETHQGAVQAKQQVAAVEQQLANVRTARGEAPKKATLAEAQAQHAARDKLVQEALAKAEARKAGRAAEQAPAGGEKPPAGTKEATALDSQVSEITRLSPDMMVQLDGMDTPMRLADAMDAVRAEAARDIEDAPLLQVAAECFLRNT